MLSWVSLNGWPDRVATPHIRLNCVPSLQRATDARYADGEWEQLSPKEALDAIAGIVLQAANQAVISELGSILHQQASGGRTHEKVLPAMRLRGHRV